MNEYIVYISLGMIVAILFSINNELIKQNKEVKDNE